MNPPDWLQAMRARCAAATKGPWEYDCFAERVFTADKKRICNVDEAEMSDHDGEWIARARDDVPALLSLTEALAGALEGTVDYDAVGIDCPVCGDRSNDLNAFDHLPDCAIGQVLARYREGPGATTGGGT